MNATSALGDLARAHLDGALIDASHAQYDRLRRVNNALADRRPAAIVRAMSASDVQKVVRIAAEHGVLLAVRCGGHSFPGLSTCDRGIVLDLSLMKEVTIDPEARTADVSGGALLGDVDAAGLRYGLVTPAGVVSHTGVGGLTLGGGMGWLSRRFGLTIDNLVGVDIVTADGRLVRAAPEEESDLFWAVRGGGGNFGVVTTFRFRMHSRKSRSIEGFIGAIPPQGRIRGGWHAIGPWISAVNTGSAVPQRPLAARDLPHHQRRRASGGQRRCDPYGLLRRHVVPCTRHI
jgi:FAD/FMN-containing dehydrogenase